MSKIQFTKIRNVKNPNRATKGSVGIDFFVPKFDEDFKKKFLKINKRKTDFKDWFLVKPHQVVKIPSGIKIRFDKRYALIFGDKSGVATKKGFLLAAKVVDSDYTGELFISLINTTDTVKFIHEDEKIVQAILYLVGYDELEEVETEEELYKDFDSERGDGGFGSTDKK